MRTITARRYGNSSVLQLAQAPLPVPQADDVLVRNFASSINPVDWKLRAGQVRLLSGIRRPPAILGSDFAGEVMGVGEAVRDFAIGDRVFGYLDPLKGGAYAEQLCVMTTRCAKIPDNIDYIQAGTVPIAALTAYQSLVGIAQLSQGQHVVINGCAGGVGVMAVQIAKLLGAKVTGVCSAKNATFAESLGADAVIDYLQDPKLEAMSAVDVFFDVVGNRFLGQVATQLTSKGRYITTIPGLGSAIIQPLLNRVRAKQANLILARSVGSDLAVIANWLAAGKLKVIVEKTYPLEQLAQAQDHSAAGHVRGKLGIEIG